MIHIVESGETLSDIAMEYGTSVVEIQQMNELTSLDVSLGQSLIIPIRVQILDAMNSVLYVVKQQDTLPEIATIFDIPVWQIKTLNDLETNDLQTGQMLQIPSPTTIIETRPRTFSATGTQLYTVQRGDSLYKIARQFKLTVQQLKDFNRLTSNSLFVGQVLRVTAPKFTASQQQTGTYTVQKGDSLYKIATKHKTTVERIRQLNQLSSNALSIGQKLIVPSSASTPSTTPRTATTTYIVQKGDTLYKIADKFGVAVNKIKELSGFISNDLYIGQKLTIPVNPNAQDEDKDDTPSQNETFTYLVQPGDSLYQIADKFDTSVTQIKQLNRLSSNSLQVGQKLIIQGKNTQEPQPSPPSGTITSYKVQAGDSLYKIAVKFNTSVSYLRQINQLNNSTLFIGQWLKVPSKTNHTQIGNIKEYIVKAGDSLSVIAWIFDTNVQDIKRLNQLSSDSLVIGQKLLVPEGKNSQINTKPTTQPTGGSTNAGSGKNNITPVSYKVQPGDSLWTIARKFDTTVDDIISLNKLTSTGLTVGQTLFIGIETGTQTGSNNNANSATSDGSNIGGRTSKDLEFSYDFTISDTVGEGGRNWGKDVRKVQSQLRKMGFLAWDAELLKNDNIAPSSMLPKTVQAIKDFQRLILGQKSPNALIKVNSPELMFLNSGVLRPSQTEMNSITTARQNFKLTITNGISLLSEGLSAAVGNTNYGNYPADLSRVQQRLVQLRYLSSWHGENFTSNTSIKPSQIPHTISALKRFQKYRVKYWANKSKIVGNTDYLYGVVKPNDLTFKILKEYTHYRVTFPDVKNPAKRVVAEFHNYPKSWFAADVSGIAYLGKVSPKSLPLQEYKNTGLNHVEAKALQYVSEHEGNFDALNTYDKAIFSYGFIQFAGGTGGLAPMLAQMKYRKPATFRKRFQQYGIDVEYSITRGDIRYAHVVVIDPSTGRVLRREMAESYLKANKLMCGVFIRAAHDIEVQRIQIESAKRKYVVPALNIRVNFNVNVDGVVLTFVDMPITQIIRSEMGMTVLIDLTVNQWVVKTSKYFTNAIKKVAKANHLDSVEKILNISEWQVLNQIVKDGDTLASSRTKNILRNSGLSTYK